MYAAKLRSRHNRAMRYQFVDCRWELGDPARGRELYVAGHIPGASFLDVDVDLSDLSWKAQGAIRCPPPIASRSQPPTRASAKESSSSPTVRRAARSGSGGCCGTSD